MASDVLTFDSFPGDIEATIAAIPGLVCLAVGVPWSPSSANLMQAVRVVASEPEMCGVRFLLMRGDENAHTASFCTRNGIVLGAGGLKMYDGGRETVVRRAKTGESTYTFLQLLRPSQVRQIVRAVLEAAASSTIPVVDL